MNQQASELKPCPFCGCVSVELKNNHPKHYDMIVYYVECRDCQAFGPCSSNFRIAEKAWNNRYNDLLPLCEEVVKCLEMPDFEHDGKQDGIGTRLLNTIAKIKGNSNDSQTNT